MRTGYAVTKRVAVALFVCGALATGALPAAAQPASPPAGEEAEAEAPADSPPARPPASRVKPAVDREQPVAPARRPPAQGTGSSDDFDAAGVRPGNGLIFRLGFAFGGETLISATLSNGEERSLDAGKGVALSIAGMVTPLWVGDSVGFGGSAEIGLFYGGIDASNGSAYMNRFPLVLHLHLLAPFAGRAYFRLAGGVDIHLGTTVGGEGVLDGFEADFDTSVGGSGEAGFYYRYTPNVAAGVAVRVTVISYSLGGQSLSGTNGGLAGALHFNF
jgi:hypothetical protein